jgi:hypothetical protein
MLATGTLFAATSPFFPPASAPYKPAKYSIFSASSAAFPTALSDWGKMPLVGSDLHSLLIVHTHPILGQHLLYMQYVPTLLNSKQTHLDVQSLESSFKPGTVQAFFPCQNYIDSILIIQIHV